MVRTCSSFAFRSRNHGRRGVFVVLSLMLACAVSLSAQHLWVGVGGGGDGTTWTDPLNWNAGSVPPMGGV